MYVAPHDSLEHLESRLKKEPHARIARRLQAVLWAKQGKSAREIATLASVQPRTVQNWMARYNAQSLPGLHDHYPGGSPQLIQSVCNAPYANLRNSQK